RTSVERVERPIDSARIYPALFAANQTSPRIVFVGGQVPLAPIGAGHAFIVALTNGERLEVGPVLARPGVARWVAGTEKDLDLAGYLRGTLLEGVVGDLGLQIEVALFVVGQNAGQQVNVGLVRVIGGLGHALIDSDVWL